MAEHDRLGPDFRRLLTGAAASNLGDGVRLAALPLLAVTLTDEAVLVAAVPAAVMAPAVLLGPLGGVLVDRHPRRLLIVVGQVVRAVAVAVFVAVLAAGAMTIWGVLTLAFVLGAGEVVVDGASSAAVPRLVPTRLLERANARMISAQLVLEQMVGSALGALLFSVRTMLPFVVDGITYVVGAAAASRLRTPLAPDRGPDVPAGTSMAQEAREGFSFIRRTPVLAWFAGVVGMTNLALTTGTSVLVLLVVETLAAPEATYGLVLTAAAVGGLIASAVIERVVAAVGRRRVFVVAGVGEVAALLVVGFAPTVVVVAVGLAISSALAVAVNVPGRAVRQEVTPDHLLGRVVSTFRVIGYGGVPLGAAVGGVVTDLAGTRAAFVVAAAIAAVAALALVRTTTHLPATGPRDRDDRR